MQVLIFSLFGVLVLLTLLVLKFLQSEEKEKKVKQGQTSDLIADLEVKLKRVQEELGKEIADKEEMESILYKTKDELDTLKVVKNELEQKAKDSIKAKEESVKKDEEIQKEAALKQKLQLELEAAKRETEELRKQKGTGEAETVALKSELTKKEALLQQANAEKEQLKLAAEAGKKEIEQLRSQAPAPDQKKLADEKEALLKENDDLTKKLRFNEEVLEGLKGQYDELSRQLEEINLKKINGQKSDSPATDSEKQSKDSKQA